MTREEWERRVWSRVDRRDDDECWPWLGSRTTAGYGNLRTADGRHDYAHRVVYALLVGPIMVGLVLDHLCRNRACVNPTHLEPVTQRENVARGASPYGPLRTRCKRDHDVTDPANVCTRPNGSHYCRPCARALDKARTR